MKTRPLALMILISTIPVLLTTGCGTTSGGGATKPTTARIVADPDANLKQGMTVEQLRGLLGEPAETRPLATSEGRGETWVYVVRTPKGVNVVTGETVSRPYFDPFTNQMKEIEEPAYRKQEIVTLVERLSLLIYDGKLEKWVKSQDVEKKLQ